MWPVYYVQGGCLPLTSFCSKSSLISNTQVADTSALLPRALLASGLGQGQQVLLGCGGRVNEIDGNFVLLTSQCLPWRTKRKRQGQVAAVAILPGASIEEVEREAVRLPLDYYKILGIEPYYREEAIEQGYSFRIGLMPEEGYSAQARAVRLEILRGARDLLSDSEARKEYNEEVRLARAAGIEGDACAVDVPLEKVPGALCLLQEAGEATLVVEVGGRLLEKGQSGGSSSKWDKNSERDVALATALAYVDLYRENLAVLKGATSAAGPGGARVAGELQPGTLARGFEYLETALKLLQDAGGPSLAPQLQAEIDEALRLLTPQCILDLLALPLDAFNASARKEGLQGVRSLLWNQDDSGTPIDPPGGISRIEFIQEAFRRMTTAEQIEFDKATPDNLDAEAAEVYSIALALTAQGFFTRRPGDIKEADSRLAELEARPEILQREGGEGGFLPQDVALERAMCALLIGQLPECLRLLGLDSDPPSGDVAVAQFVYEHSPEADGVWWAEQREAGLDKEGACGEDAMDEDGLTEGDRSQLGQGYVSSSNSAVSSSGTVKPISADQPASATSALLPGLCVFLQWWLQECLVPRFRDLEAKEVVLADYFDDPSVIRQLDSMDRGSSLSLTTIVGAGAQARGAALQALQSLRTVLANGKEAVSLRANEGAQRPLPNLSQSNGRASAQSDAGSTGAVAPAVVARNRSLREMMLRDRAAFGEGGEGETAAILGGWLGEGRGEPRGEPDAREETGRTGVLPRGAAEGHAEDSRGGDAGRVMGWLPRKAGTVLLGSLLLVGAGVAGVMGSGMLGGPSRLFRGGGAFSASPAVAVAPMRGEEWLASKTTAGGSRRVSERHQRMAREVVDSWQEAKAAAMGRQHEIQRLEEVLEGPMLDTWHKRAVTAMTNNWHWEFDFLDLKIGDVEIAPDGHRATMEAVIQEAARMFDPSQPLGKDSYRDSYTVHYDLVLTETGWKIYDGTVVR